MYYKILNNQKVVDVLDYLSYAKYNEKNRLILCPPEQAQVIVASDGNGTWHVRGLYAVPGQTREKVDLVEIDEFEYKQLKALNGKTPEEIIDEYTLLLIEEGLL